MRYFRLILLLSAALSCSGYRWRCYIACDDQTAIQNDYVENRDACREESQANLDEAMIKSGATDTPKARKLKLITLFSDCMGKYGWEVPIPGDKESKIAAEVPIYESTVSKVRAAQPKDGATPAAADQKVIEKETNQDQKPLERKVPPENVGKQEKQAQASNETNNQDNNKAAATKEQTETTARSAGRQNQQPQQRERVTANNEQQKTTTNNTNNTNTHTPNQKTPPTRQQTAEQDQPKEMLRQPATTARSATGAQPDNTQQAQAQRQQQAQIAANNNTARTLSQAAPPQQAAEPDQPKGMLRQPATTARPANQPQPDKQPDNMQLAQLEPQAGPQTQENTTNNNTTTNNTTNNSRTIEKKAEEEQQNPQKPATREEQAIENVRRQQAAIARPKEQSRQNAQMHSSTAAPVTTVTPESPEQALTQSIQKHPAETNIKYQNKGQARHAANRNGPTPIPQQPATTQQQSVSSNTDNKVAAVIDPANNQTPVTAITTDSPDQALLESIHKKPKRVKKNSGAVSRQPQQTQAQTSSVPQGQTQPQSASQMQQPSQVVTQRHSTTAVAPTTVNNVNNSRYNNTTTSQGAANSSNASKIPSQPAVTKKQPITPRAAECEQARRNSATSTLAAQQAKECDLECAKIMKATPKIINPAPCPVKDAAIKDAAINVLDSQLGSKK